MSFQAVYLALLEKSAEDEFGVLVLLWRLLASNRMAYVKEPPATADLPVPELLPMAPRAVKCCLQVL